MNIGIKHCGGCNSQYDRVKLIEGFRKDIRKNRYYGVLDGELTKTYGLLYAAVRARVHVLTDPHRQAEDGLGQVFEELALWKRNRQAERENKLIKGV